MDKNFFLADRYINEKLPSYWNVDESLESFNLFLNHIEKTTNFKLYFEEAFNQLMSDRKEKDMVVLDIGGGIGWTSALMAKHPRIKKVLILEPSSSKRLIHKHIAKHFKVPEDKIESINGTFQDFNLSEKVDVCVLCGSLHHCLDEFIPLLFHNIEKSLKNPIGKSRVLIANDHIVTPLWTLKRFAGYIKNTILVRRETLWNSLRDLRAPQPYSLEHWRSRKELDIIIKNASYTYRFFKIKDSDLTLKNPSYLYKLQWVYYYSLLDRITE
jgi:SAM-dependent methyltransferase